MIHAKDIGDNDNAEDNNCYQVSDAAKGLIQEYFTFSTKAPLHKAPAVKLNSQGDNLRVVPATSNTPKTFRRTGCSGHPGRVAPMTDEMDDSVKSIALVASKVAYSQTGEGAAQKQQCSKPRVETKKRGQRKDGTGLRTKDSIAKAAPLGRLLQREEEKVLADPGLNLAAIATDTAVLQIGAPLPVNNTAAVKSPRRGPGSRPGSAGGISVGAGTAERPTTPTTSRSTPRCVTHRVVGGISPAAELLGRPVRRAELRSDCVVGAQGHWDGPVGLRPGSSGAHANRPHAHPPGPGRSLPSEDAGTETRPAVPKLKTAFGSRVEGHVAKSVGAGRQGGAVTVASSTDGAVQGQQDAGQSVVEINTLMRQVQTQLHRYLCIVNMVPSSDVKAEKQQVQQVSENERVAAGPQKEMAETDATGIGDGGALFADSISTSGTRVRTTGGANDRANWASFVNNNDGKWEGEGQGQNKNALGISNTYRDEKGVIRVNGPAPASRPRSAPSTTARARGKPSSAIAGARIGTVAREAGAVREDCKAEGRKKVLLHYSHEVCLDIPQFSPVGVKQGVTGAQVADIGDELLRSGGRMLYRAEGGAAERVSSARTRQASAGHSRPQYKMNDSLPEQGPEDDRASSYLLRYSAASARDLDEKGAVVDAHIINSLNVLIEQSSNNAWLVRSRTFQEAMRLIQHAHEHNDTAAAILACQILRSQGEYALKRQQQQQQQQNRTQFKPQRQGAEQQGPSGSGSGGLDLAGDMFGDRPSANDASRLRGHHPKSVEIFPHLQPAQQNDAVAVPTTEVTSIALMSHGDDEVFTVSGPPHNSTAPFDRSGFDSCGASPGDISPKRSKDSPTLAGRQHQQQQQVCHKMPAQETYHQSLISPNKPKSRRSPNTDLTLNPDKIYLSPRNGHGGYSDSFHDQRNARAATITSGTALLIRAEGNAMRGGDPGSTKSRPRSAAPVRAIPLKAKEVHSLRYTRAPENTYTYEAAAVADEVRRANDITVVSVGLQQRPTSAPSHSRRAQQSGQNDRRFAK